jgi:hypothetical protein
VDVAFNPAASANSASRVQLARQRRTSASICGTGTAT